MYSIVEMVRDLFQFRQYEFVISFLGILLLLSNFCGGLLFNIVRGLGRPREDVPLKQRISFRLHLLSLIFVFLFAVYFHAMLLGGVTALNIVYWVLVMLASSALAFIGAKITYAVYANKIEANRKAYEEWLEKKKANTPEAREAARKAELEETIKKNAELKAKIARARQSR